ncbi:hypothetical protein GCM10022225_14540 [Plantactinospora mayteni]|uniref:Uncharacterized protein n=1 Tax=Plantactinospora mayteni TaxID=566021 RepID=A0ABQ4EFU3_9ACTN|nr:hypothetical protein Pma05_01020 [Plantactinospora mayteni]
MPAGRIPAVLAVACPGGADRQVEPVDGGERRAAGVPYLDFLVPGLIASERER